MLVLSQTFTSRNWLIECFVGMGRIHPNADSERLGMSRSAVQTLQALLSNPLSLENVRSLVTPVTHVWLSENNPKLPGYLPE